MPSDGIQWVTFSGNVAAWLAILYMIISLIWGSPELRVLKDQLKRMDKHISDLIDKLPVGKKG